MAIKSTIFKAHLTIADIERSYYQEHSLVLARHPSETDVRMIVRLAVFALNAHEHLQFTKGLSSVDEPDLWQIDLTGAVEHWIDIGQPTEKRIRQACGKAGRVSIYTFQRGAAKSWFAGMEKDLVRFKHLRVFHVGFSDEAAVERLVDRSMQLHCVIEDGQVLLSNNSESISIEIKVLKGAMA